LRINSVISGQKSAILKLYYFLGLVALLFSCSSYKQSILFKLDDRTSVQQASLLAEKNYTLEKNDVFHLKVYTKNGERIIDPDKKLSIENSSQTPSERSEEENFLVNQQGVAKLPMIGELKVEGLTVREVEEFLQKEYSAFYENVWVTVEFTSHRVIVLGAPGGQVIPLQHENTTLVEVIALSKGFVIEGKANNIRLLRGNQVFVADFSTIEGYQKSNQIVHPGDVVYIEPVRRPVVETLRDYGPILTTFTTLAALIFAITR
jgi:polysaccharide biosynthesis/export protein